MPAYQFRESGLIAIGDESFELLAVRHMSHAQSARRSPQTIDHHCQRASRHSMNPVAQVPIRYCPGDLVFIHLFLLRLKTTFRWALFFRRRNPLLNDEESAQSS
jgi:hypothetical protein